MTRARGRDAQSRRRPPRAIAVVRGLPKAHLRGFGAALLAVLFVAGCGASIDTASPLQALPSAATPTGSGPAGSPDVSASSTGSPNDATQPTTVPSGPGSASPDTSPGDGSTSASDCSGSDQNRAFFADAAVALPWDVYCPVLPDAWFVETGSYRLGDGGTLRIAYKGPDGARIELREGAICGDPSACRPAGQEIGTTAFGDRQGTLIALEGGGHAVVVDAGAPVSWLAVGANLDEATFRDLVAAVHRVAP